MSVQIYRFDYPDGSSKVWAVSPLNYFEYMVWWGKSDSILVNKVIRGDWQRKVSEKTRKGYYQVPSATIDRDNRVVWGQESQVPIVKNEAKRSKRKKCDPSVTAFFREDSEFSF